MSFFGSLLFVARPLACLRRWMLVLGGLCLQLPVIRAEAPPAITEPVMIWLVPGPLRERAHELQLEGRVSYYDPGFKMLWLEVNQLSHYIQLGEVAPDIRTGQRVTLTGRFVPKDGLDAREIRVRVLEENAPFTPLDTKDRIHDYDALHARMVTVEGYVDSQQYVDAQHVRLILLVENRPVICWVRPDDPTDIPDWQGKFVRVTGLYSRKFDPTFTSATIELWVGTQAALSPVEDLESSSRFAGKVTPIETLSLLPLQHEELLVRGRLEKQIAGKTMTLRDETGQVEVHSVQQQHLPIGSMVEAVGKLNRFGGQLVIDQALYRPVATAAGAGSSVTTDNELLRTVAQIRTLGTKEAGQGHAVEINGMVSWVLPDSPYLYLQDLTGGIRVHFDRKKTGEIRFGKYLKIRGVTRAGRITPEVELREMVDLGSMSHPAARPITLEQALTGQAEGDWVELSGFIQNSVFANDRCWIHVTTPVGDFTGLLDNPVSFVANTGSLLRVHGVCDLSTPPDRNTKGVLLRVPFIHNIKIEADAPADYFALPLHSLKDLAQLSAGEGMQRVRVQGTVLHHAPGSRVYLEEAGTGLLLLTRDRATLNPGARIEAVGILGREGARTILRETVFRTLAGTGTPTPRHLDTAAQPITEADSRLVKLRGTLIEVATLRHLGQTRLTLQQDNALFEALLEDAAGLSDLEHMLGASLDVTGIYQLKFDDFRQARGFQILLRSPADVSVRAKPRFLNLQRALTVSAILGGGVLLGLFWIYSLRRRLQQQTMQLLSQLEQQARLEAEIQRATRLESLGVLAGGIAHDYNNLLTVIMGNLSLMKFTPQVIALEGSRVEEIEKAALRARDLTRQLLTFAEGGEPMRTVVATAELLHSALSTIPRSPTITYDHAIAAYLPPVLVDRDQILQALQNLLRNALDAMPNGGCLRVMAAAAEVAAGFNHNLTPGRYVRISIADTGNGIPSDVLPRIFDPYFSTKKSGGGLGLATVYSIVKKHHGHIEALSRPQQGATFTFWLQVADEPGKSAQLPLPLPSTEQAHPANAEPAKPTPPRVLLMDDEESIRKLGTILLERLGCEVITAKDGTEALLQYREARSAQKPFALLVLDLTVNGGMGGLEVIQQIRPTDPATPAIVSSGYSRDPVMAHYRDHGFHGIIPKPYDMKRFRETVSALLPNLLPHPPTRPPV